MSILLENYLFEIQISEAEFLDENFKGLMKKITPNFVEKSMKKMKNDFLNKDNSTLRKAVMLLGKDNLKVEKLQKIASKIPNFKEAFNKMSKEKVVFPMKNKKASTLYKILLTIHALQDSVIKKKPINTSIKNTVSKFNKVLNYEINNSSSETRRRLPEGHLSDYMLGASFVIVATAIGLAIISILASSAIYLFGSVGFWIVMVIFLAFAALLAMLWSSIDEDTE